MNFLSIKLEEWWEDYAYLRPRYPLAPTINMSGLCVFFEDHFWPPEDGTQITRSAITVYYILKEWKLLYRCGIYKIES